MELDNLVIKKQVIESLNSQQMFWNITLFILTLLILICLVVLTNDKVYNFLNKKGSSPYTTAKIIFIFLAVCCFIAIVKTGAMHFDKKHSELSIYGSLMDYVVRNDLMREEEFTLITKTSESTICGVENINSFDCTKLILSGEKHLYIRNEFLPFLEEGERYDILYIDGEFLNDALGINYNYINNYTKTIKEVD